MAALDLRSATPSDIPRVTEIFTSAFFEDPVWGAVFPDRERRRTQLAGLWSFAVESALRYPCTFVTPGLEAAALWIPPNGTELTDEEEERFHPYLVELAGQALADELADIFARLWEQSPKDEAFWYLSLLGTHEDHRGRGIGMDLLRASLERVDAEHMPAYLESTNPLNDRRYASVGFEQRGTVVLANGTRVNTMWRPAR